MGVFRHDNIGTRIFTCYLWWSEREDFTWARIYSSLCIYICSLNRKVSLCELYLTLCCIVGLDRVLESSYLSWVGNDSLQQYHRKEQDYTRDHNCHQECWTFFPRGAISFSFPTLMIRLVLFIEKVPKTIQGTKTRYRLFSSLYLYSSPSDSLSPKNPFLFSWYIKFCNIFSHILECIEVKRCGQEPRSVFWCIQ